MNNDSKIITAILSLMVAFMLIWGAMEFGQGDRDARRLDVIEAQLGIRGPDAPPLTIDERVATAIAERDAE